MEIDYFESWPKCFSRELLKLNVLNEIWFTEFTNNQEIKSETQGLRECELKWQFYLWLWFYYGYFVKGSIAIIKCHRKFWLIKINTSVITIF